MDPFQPNQGPKPNDSKTLNEWPLMNSATVLQQLVHGTPSERAEAAENLAHQGPDAAYAVSALLAACEDTESVSTWAVAALEELGPPPLSAITALGDLAQSDKPLTAYWAVTLLGRAGRQAADCQEILAILLMGTSELALREKAAWALGRMKADSRKAKLALQVAARSPEKRLSRMGSKALKQIEKK